MTSFNDSGAFGSYNSPGIPMMNSGHLDTMSRSLNHTSSVSSAKDPKSLGKGEGQTVERKRRDNINDKIQELGTIIPTNFFDINKEKSSGTKDGKPNKGQILSKSIEYIEFLQDKIDENNKKEIEFLIVLKKLEELKRIPDELKPSKTLFKHTSAEIALQNIGVGPLAEDTNNNERKESTAGSNSRVNSPNVSIGPSHQRNSIVSVGSPLANPNNYDGVSVAASPSIDSETAPFARGAPKSSPGSLGAALNNGGSFMASNFSNTGQQFERNDTTGDNSLSGFSNDNIDNFNFAFDT